MATTIGNLAVKLTVQSASFVKGMQRAIKPVKEFGRRIAETSARLARYSAVALTAATAATVLFVKRTMAAIDATAKVSQKLGIATEDLIALRFAAKLGGAEIRTFDMALQRVTRRISEAAAGTGEAKQALIDLGVDAKRVGKAGPAEAILTIADAMEKLEIQGDRVRLSFKLFDSEGVALVNLVSRGRKAIEEMAAAVRRAGADFSNVAAAKIEMANDAISRATLLWTAFWQELTIRVSPAVTLMADQLFEAATAGSSFGSKVGAAFDAVGRGMAKLLGQFENLHILLIEMQLGLALFASGIVQSVNSVVQAVTSFFGGMWDTFISKLRRVSQLWGTFVRFLKIGLKGPLSKIDIEFPELPDLSKPSPEQAKRTSFFDAIQKDLADVTEALLLDLGKIHDQRRVITFGEHILAAWRKFMDKMTRAAETAAEDARRRGGGLGIPAGIDALRSRAEQITKTLRTPAEKMRDSMRELNKLLEAGLISAVTWGRGAKKAAEDYAKTLDMVAAKVLQIANPATMDLTPVIQAGTAEAFRVQFRTSQRLAAGTVEKKQLVELKGINETTKEQNEILRQGLGEFAVMDMGFA